MIAKGPILVDLRMFEDKNNFDNEITLEKNMFWQRISFGGLMNFKVVIT